MEYAGSLEELKEIWMRVYTGHLVKWQLSNPTQDNTLHIPTLNSNDRFVFTYLQETLRNKTLDGTNTVGGLNAGYLTVSESISSFMTAWRAFFQPNAKAASWEALAAADVANLAGVTSSIASQFGANFSQHASFRMRISALEGSASGRPAAAHLVVNEAVKLDTVGALFTTVTKTFAAVAAFQPYSTPDEGAMYVVSNKAAGNLTVSSWTIPHGGYLWIRYSEGAWYAVEAGGDTLPSQLIEIIDIPGGSPVEDMSPQNLVFVRRANPMPGTVRFADGVAHPNKIYFCSNYSDESSMYCTDNSESTTFEILPSQWAVFSFDAALSLWVKMESGLLTQGSGGPVGLNQGSTELTADYQDTSTYNWHFVEKKLAGAMTFTLKLSPSAGMLVQVKNSSGAGTIMVGGNGAFVGGAPALVVAPGTFAWLLFRGAAWHLLESAVTQQLVDTLTLPVASNCEVREGEPAQWVSSEAVTAAMHASEVVVGALTSYATYYIPTIVASAALNDTAFVLAYLGSGAQGAEPIYVQLVTRAGLFLQYQPPVLLLATQTSRLLSVVRLSDTQFVVNSGFTCFIGTVTGNSITLGTSSAFTGTLQNEYVLYRLSDTKFIVVYGFASSVKARVGSVSGSVITYGTELAVATAQGALLGYGLLDATRVLVIHGTNAEQYYRVITNTSGTALVAGAAFVTGTTASSNMGKASGIGLDPFTAGFMFRDYASYEMHALTVSVSSDVVSSVTKIMLYINIGTYDFNVHWHGSQAYVSAHSAEYALFTRYNFDTRKTDQVYTEFLSNPIKSPTISRNCGVSLASMPGTFGLVTTECSGMSQLAVKLISLGTQLSGVTSMFRQHTGVLCQLPVGSGYARERRWNARSSTKIYTNPTITELITYYFNFEYIAVLMQYSAKYAAGPQHLYVIGNVQAPSTYSIPNTLVAAGDFMFARMFNSVLVLNAEGSVLGPVLGVGPQYITNGVAWPAKPAATYAGSKSYMAVNAFVTNVASVQFIEASGTTYRVLAGSNISGFHYLAAHQGMFYMYNNDTIYRRTIEQVTITHDSTVWITDALLLDSPHQVFMVQTPDHLWWAAIAAGKIQLARPGAISNTLTISTDAAAVQDPNIRSMHVIQVSDTLMLAVYSWTSPRASVKMRVIEVVGDTLIAGTEHVFEIYGTGEMGGTNTRVVSLVMLGDQYNIHVSASADNIYVADFYVQVLDVNRVHAATTVQSPGEYLGLVTATDGSMATIKIGAVVDNLAGLTPGDKYFVSEPGGLTSITKEADTRVGRALSPTQLRQRGPLVD